MRTTIEIDDDVMCDVMQRTGPLPKKAAMGEGLRLPIRRAHRQAIRDLRGKIPRVGDVLLLELLQGMTSSRALRLMDMTLGKPPKVTLLDVSIARRAAGHDRMLRAFGIRPRRAADLIIGTCCIALECELLHRDRDFIPMQRYLGLRTRRVPAL
jgi:predicted nucleic acid-binding protein